MAYPVLAYIATILFILDLKPEHRIMQTAGTNIEGNCLNVSVDDVGMPATTAMTTIFCAVKRR